MTALTRAAAQRGDAGDDAVRRTAVVFAGLAAAAHGAVAWDHLGDAAAVGALFAAVALAQAGLALGLARRRLGTTALSVALWANVAMIVVYVVSRTALAPVDGGGHTHGAHVHGAPHGSPGPVGMPDMVALVGELTLVALVIALLPPRASARASSALLLVGLALWSSSALGFLD